MQSSCFYQAKIWTQSIGMKAFDRSKSCNLLSFLGNRGTEGWMTCEEERMMCGKQWMTCRRNDDLWRGMDDLWGGMDDLWEEWMYGCLVVRMAHL